MPADPAAIHRRVGQLMTRSGAAGALPPTPLENGLRSLLTAAEAILAVDCIGILLLDETGHLRSVASSGPIAAEVEAAQEHLGVGPGIDTQRLSTTVIVDDLQHDERYPRLAATVAAPGVLAIVSAPIWVGEDLAGNLNAMRTQPGRWAPEDVAAVETYAGIVASLLELDAATVRHSPTSANEEEPDTS